MANKGQKSPGQRQCIQVTAVLKKQRTGCCMRTAGYILQAVSQGQEDLVSYLQEDRQLSFSVLNTPRRINLTTRHAHPLHTNRTVIIMTLVILVILSYLLSNHYYMPANSESFSGIQTTMFHNRYHCSCFINTRKSAIEQEAEL